MLPSISLHQVAGAAVLTNMSENAGALVFREVAPGDYLIDAAAPGLTIVKPETLTVVQVRISASQSIWPFQL